MSLRDTIGEKTARLSPVGDMAQGAAVAPANKSPRSSVGMFTQLQETRSALEALTNSGNVLEIDIAAIAPNPRQPRKIFEPDAIATLAASINEVGLLQPVVVRQDPNDASKFQLIAGERRWRAHQQLGRAAIKAVVVEISDDDLAVLALAENISREDLSDYEIGKSIREAEREFPNRKRMAEALGLARSELYRYLSFDKLPEFMQASLEANPKLLGGTACSEICSALSRWETFGQQAARELWPRFEAGGIDQMKLAGLINSLAESMANKQKGEESPEPATRELQKLYLGKTQIGSVVKDANTFVLKLKVSALSPAKEVQLRDTIERLFSSTPEVVQVSAEDEA